MRLKIDRTSKIPMYMQIKNQIRDKIYSKNFPKNYILSSERELSSILKVNRSTVIKAYEELKAEGLVDSKVGRGTFVIYNNDIEDDEKLHSFINGVYWDDAYSEHSQKNQGDSISKIMKTNENQKIISFSGGMPCTDLFPENEFRKIHKNMLNENMKNIFIHSPVDGYEPLKYEISKLLLNKGINTGLKEIMITSGSQQGLDLLIRTFINKGDVILVEEPTFFAALQILKTIGAKIIGIPMDNRGMKTEVVEYLIKKHKPKCIYTMPTFHNPTGVTMDIKRRNELLKICSKYNVLIIEDDPYGDLRYEGEELPTLKALDENNQVIYLSTFSKTIALGLRVGWIVGPCAVIKKVSGLKQITDLHVNTLSQYTLCEFLRNGYYHKHIKKIKQEYIIKRNLMAKELNKNSLEECLFEIPKGGYYIWYKISDKLNPSALMKSAMKRGINYMPGQVFYHDAGKNHNHIRLNFTYSKKSEIIEGIKRLKEIIK